MTKIYGLTNGRTIMADVDEKHHTATVNVYALNDLVIEANKPGQWIPVSEGLPEAFEHCLWTTTNGDVIYHHWDGLISKYKAWMPLPKPYESQERSE